MEVVAMTAFGVGGATVVGAAIGFCFQKISEKTSDAILGFAAGVMLAAAVLGLIVPSMESAGKSGIWMTAAGILMGAFFLNVVDKLMPHLHHLTGARPEERHGQSRMGRVELFVMAIAIHNLPEGLAAGVGFGSGDVGSAMTIALGIALQNIPEGMIIISPMIASGISRRRTFFIAAGTGLVEVAGTFIGYFAVGASGAVLPFALAFAGGTMLYVISDEMIPETHSHGYERIATYALLVGFIVMLLMDAFL